jgi:beta-glucosidase/6-phospho-beta-glucosidase/beta-galactosidase
VPQPRVRYVEALVALLATAVTVACNDHSSVADGTSDMTAGEGLPPAFAFGTAIAGFQVDMGCRSIPAATCEDRGSDWYQWITTQRIVDNPLLFMSKDPPSRGPGFYEAFEEDIARASGELGNNALRLSIEWSRIFPTSTVGVEGQDALRAIASRDGIAYYHRIFGAMRARGLRPFVTVNHYTLPLWIHDGNACNQSLDACIKDGHGGWADPDRARIVGEIAKYAGFVAREYGADVDDWATENEPFSAVVLPGYLLSTPMRSTPPGLSGPWASVRGAKTAATAMVEAHARMYDAIHGNDLVDADGDGAAAKVGLVYAYVDIASNGTSDADNRAADDARYFLNDMFMDGIALGRLDESWDHAPGAAPVRADLANRCDFIGVNYYARFKAKPALLPLLSFVSPHVTFELLPSSFIGDAPRGILPVLRDVAKYHLPLYVTETGAVQDDEVKGAAWLVDTLAEVRNARREGIDVRGYFTWTLMDNYEWNQGTHTRMGLYAVDASNPQKPRRPREAARVYAEITKARDVSAALEEHYRPAYP